MTPPNPTFIVLDLETTGLDTEQDAIIEIAAIRFTLEKDNDGTWQAIEKEEKSMLVNPERELTEEISLITHITDSMLENKPVWSTIQEKVRAFIGESVIIGHNVLFDVAMLKTHGIDLRENTILDTFELSELFSSESESLNLGFLGALYGLKTEKGEHRALGDVEICLGLFLQYLNQIRSLNENKKSILRLLATKEEKNNIGYILELLGEERGAKYELSEKYASRFQNDLKIEKRKDGKKNQIQPRIISLSGKREEEMNILQDAIGNHKKIHILTTGYKVSSSLKTLLEETGYMPTIGIRQEKWCSIRYINECIISDESWERKLSILIGRILFWLEETSTGLLSELKVYGKEYEYIDNFRMEEGEINIFSQKYDENLKESHVVIYEMYDYFQIHHEKPECLIVKDIGFIDDKARRALSFTVDITELIEEIQLLVREEAIKEKIIHALSLIKHIYEGIPVRPSGKSEFPPGQFGETYFFNQETLWKKGGIWIPLATRILESSMNKLPREDILSVSISKRWRKICDSLSFLISYHKHTSSRTSIVIEISEKNTLLKYIPRDLSLPFTQVLKEGASESILLYGYGIGGKKISTFLKNELSIIGEAEVGSNRDTHDIIVKEGLDSLFVRGGIILTTSMKHIRELGQLCERRGIKTLMQGISGGKSKIYSLFRKNADTTILIGLIDTWKDEEDLWKVAKSVTIAKLPFDPPSDPYFLSRTVGMSNNFTHYSEPMVILRVNTLIGNIRTSGYCGHIYTLDVRLTETIWGRGIYEELL